MGWLNSLLIDTVMEVFQYAVEGLADIINNVFKKMNEIMQIIRFDVLEQYAMTIALSLVVLFGIKQGIMVYVLHTDGDADADALELLTRFALSICMIICGPWLMHKLTEIAALLCEDVEDAVTGLIYAEPLSEQLLGTMNKLTSMINRSGYTLPLLVMFLTIIVLLIVFVFKAAKRAAEVELFAIMIPLYALDLLTTQKEKWSAFFTEAMICIFGYILQVFCYRVFMGLMQLACSTVQLEYMIACISWLLLCISAPKWLQRFTYSSGVGAAAKSGARSTVMVVQRLISKK